MHVKKNSFLAVIDGLAVFLSGACIVHCLFLPVLISVLPVLESLVEREWVHQVMVLLALPVTGLALMNIMQRRFLISGFMFVGLGLLLSAAFISGLHDFETSLTVSGALILSGGHMMRWHAQKTLNS